MDWNRNCDKCARWRPWTEAEKFAHIESIFKSIGRIPDMELKRGFCTKIPKGTKWEDDEGRSYAYDGYSLESENYDEVFNCFEEGAVDGLEQS